MGWNYKETINKTAAEISVEFDSTKLGQYAFAEAPENRWYINQYPTIRGGVYFDVAINFASNGTTFNRIRLNSDALEYNYSDVCTYWSGWLNQAYRTVIFETAPTGTLLTWLQANAIKLE